MNKWFAGLGLGLVVAANLSFGAQTYRFKMWSSVDQQGIGIEAFRMLVPEGWQAQGGVQWTMQTPAMPAIIAFQVTNPQGTAQLEFLPNQAFYYSEAVLQMFPIGSRCNGLEVCPPMGAADYIQKIVIPRARQNCRNVRVVKTQPLPEIAQMLLSAQPLPPQMQQLGIQLSGDAAKVSIEYQFNNVWIEEDIYAFVQATNTPIQTMYGTMNSVCWLTDYTFSFKAVKGQMKNFSVFFETMTKSFQVNPTWYSKYTQILQMLVANKIQQIHSIGQLSQYISQTSNEISDMIMNSYNARQATYDRVFTKFDQYVRGVDEYHDPISQMKVELPSGCDRGWTNGLGEYIISDDPNFEPNIQSNIRWTPMKKTP